MKKHHYHHDYRKEHANQKHFDTVLILRLLRYLRPYRLPIACAITLLLISKGIDAYIPIYLGNITQRILDHFSSTPLFSSCLIAMGLILTSYLMDAINVLIKSYVGQKTLYALRIEVYQHLLHLSLDFHNRHAVGKMMTRTIHDVDQINHLFAESVVPIISSVLLFVGISVAVIFVDWRVAIAIAMIIPIVAWLTNRFRYYQRLCYDRIRGIVSAMNGFVQEHLMGAATIRNFGLHQQEKQRFEEINEDHYQAYNETIHHFSTFIAGIDLLQSISLITVFTILIAFSPVNAGFQAGTFFTFSLYALMFFRPLLDLADRYNVLQSAMAAADRIFDILDTPPKTQDRKIGKTLQEIETITFDNVWFAYEKDNWILKALSFSINKGEAIALVGITGAGKTSILNLLLRLYDHQKGSIKINGIDIREYSLNSLRKQCSIVLQDPVIFSGTIADNISLQQPEVSQEQLETIVDYLNLHPLLSRFSDGMQHRLMERGKELSLGEKQLIALARAIAHKHSLLILDEATASIDTATERMIQEAMQKVLQDKTALVIAHRLSTIRDSTRILVLHKGTIAETGTHKQLLKEKGLYEKLYRFQFMNEVS